MTATAQQRVIIESPLAGDVPENFRYLLWCCRAVWRRMGKYPIATHLVCPWFMDDADPAERAAGIDSPWGWDRSVPHYFFEDLDVSRGMALSLQRCIDEDIAHAHLRLADFPVEWEGFLSGGWPTHTAGFELRVAP